MRPAAGGNALALPKRKTSFDNDAPAPASAAAGPPTAFFMASESMLDAGRTPTASADTSMFGVRSLEEEKEEEEGEPSRPHSAPASDARRGSPSPGRKRPTVTPVEPGAPADATPADSVGRPSPPAPPLGTSPPRALLRRHPHSDLLSQPLTPLSFASPLLGSSAPSSPKSLSARSLRPSSEDGSLGDRASQAVASSDEDDDEGGPAPDRASAMPAPQLIMPSIMMPSRRPFTENGKRLGRLKVLLAGGSGTLGIPLLLPVRLTLCQASVRRR